MYFPYNYSLENVLIFFLEDREDRSVVEEVKKEAVTKI